MVDQRALGLFKKLVKEAVEHGEQQMGAVGFPKWPLWEEGGGNQCLRDCHRAPRHSAAHLTWGIFLKAQTILGFSLKPRQLSIIPLL